MANPEIIKIGLGALQICVPKNYTDDEVIAFAKQEGGDANWEIRREGDPEAKGDLERNACAEHPENCHIVVQF